MLIVVYTLSILFLSSIYFFKIDYRDQTRKIVMTHIELHKSYFLLSKTLAEKNVAINIPDSIKNTSIYKVVIKSDSIILYLNNQNIRLAFHVKYNA